MGDGDVVLMALIGAVLGWQPVLVVFFLAPPGSDPVRHRNVGPSSETTTPTVLPLWSLVKPVSRDFTAGMASYLATHDSCF